MSPRVGVTYGSREKLPPYLRALEAAGLEPVPIHASEEIASMTFTGLCLTGGTDVNAALYNQERHAEADLPDDPRDELELALLQQALAADLPVLAICRGMQLLNVAHGGTLCQHIAAVDFHRVRPKDAALTAHRIEVAPGSKLAAIIGAGEHEVNSRHHQAVAQVGSGLSISAIATDGLVEGLERLDRAFVIAVQWHPEDRIFSDRKDLQLFEAFAAACRLAAQADESPTRTR
jgi:gamma-glutamyl-gamma-aminobutyrate hydrolase PuuD